MIPNPSEAYENYTPGADTTSRADYSRYVPDTEVEEAVARVWDRLLPCLDAPTREKTTA